MPAKHLPLVRLILWLCTLAAASAIFSFSAQDGPVSSAASNRVAEIIVDLIDADFDALPAENQASILSFVRKLVRKGAHFTEFAVLGLCIRLLVSTYTRVHGSSLSWLIGTLYACTDEVHQLFVSSRAGMWQDVLLDSVGVLAGVTVGYALLELWRRRMGRRSEGT